MSPVSIYFCLQFGHSFVLSNLFLSMIRFSLVLVLQRHDGTHMYILLVDVNSRLSFTSVILFISKHLLFVVDLVSMILTSVMIRFVFYSLFLCFIMLSFLIFFYQRCTTLYSISWCAYNSTSIFDI